MKYSIFPMILLVGLVVGCQATPQPAPGMGALHVTVTADPNKAAAAARPSVYDSTLDADYNAMSKVDFAGLRDIVVWVEDGTGKSPSNYQPAPLKVDLNGIGGTPGLAGAASVGQTVTIHNAGLSTLRINSLSDDNIFNLVIPSFQDGSFVVKSAGIIKVRNMDDPSTAVLTRIYATPVGPVFVAQPGGTVDFNNLSPGHYTIVAWQRQVPGSITEIDVAPDRVTNGAINIGANLASKQEAK